MVIDSHSQMTCLTVRQRGTVADGDSCEDKHCHDVAANRFLTSQVERLKNGEGNRHCGFSSWIDFQHRVSRFFVAFLLPLKELWIPAKCLLLRVESRHSIIPTSTQRHTCTYRWVSLFSSWRRYYESASNLIQSKNGEKNVSYYLWFSFGQQRIPFTLMVEK